MIAGDRRQRDTCPVCGRWVAIRNDGTLYGHRRTVFGDACAGGGEPRIKAPAEPAILKQLDTFEGLVKGTPALYTKMGTSLPREVHCRLCGRSQAVDPGSCLRVGWPKCCGQTMSLDKPAEANRG